jgi:hypothetical protein
LAFWFFHAAFPIKAGMGTDKPVKRRSGKSNWKKPGCFQGCNQNRKAYVTARELVLLTDAQQPAVNVAKAGTATVGTQTDEGSTDHQTLHRDGNHENAPEKTDSCVGESLWGDAFLAWSIFDMP